MITPSTLPMLGATYLTNGPDSTMASKGLVSAKKLDKSRHSGNRTKEAESAEWTDNDALGITVSVKSRSLVRVS